MKYNLKVDNNILILVFHGDLIGGTDSLDLMDAINDYINQGIMKSVIDMSEVRYMNSSGIGILITIYTKFKNRNGNAVISNASEQIMKLLAITKLDTVIKIYPTFEEAKNSI